MLKSGNSKKMSELNKLAYRYEVLKEEYEVFLGRLEDKKNLVMTQLQTNLIVERRVKKEMLEERDRLEAETLSQLVKEKKRRLNPQECKLFKAHFKENMGNFKIVDFEASHTTEHLRSVERLWKSLLLDHAAASYDSLYEEFAKDNGDLSKKEEAVLKKRVCQVKLQIAEMEKEIDTSLPKLNTQPEALDELLEKLKISQAEERDKPYELSNDFLDSCLNEPAPVPKQPVTAPQDPTEEPNPPEEPKPKEKTPKAKPKPVSSVLYPADIKDRFTVGIAFLDFKLSFNKNFVSKHLPGFFDKAWMNLKSKIKEIVETSPCRPQLFDTELWITLSFIFKQASKEEYRSKLKGKDEIVLLTTNYHLFLDKNSSSVDDCNRSWLKTTLGRWQRSFTVACCDLFWSATRVELSTIEICAIIWHMCSTTRKPSICLQTSNVNLGRRWCAC